jgi:hypothetical protein
MVGWKHLRVRRKLDLPINGNDLLLQHTADVTCTSESPDAPRQRFKVGFLLR